MVVKRYSNGDKAAAAVEELVVRHGGV